jgi:predicted nucleic acid-binding protein
LANFELIFSRLIEGRIVSFDHLAAEHAAELMAQRKRMGRPGERRDTMIAGIVLATHATRATRNVRHFEEIAALPVHPWAA